MRPFRVAALLLVALLCPACASSTLQMQLQGDVVLDQTNARQSRAVTVYVCLLKSDEEFRTLTAEKVSGALLDGKTMEELLGSTWARIGTYTIAAGTQPLQLQYENLPESVKHVGLIALFNNPSENWRWLGTLSEARGRSFYLMGYDLLPEKPAGQPVKADTTKQE